MEPALQASLSLIPCLAFPEKACQVRPPALPSAIWFMTVTSPNSERSPDAFLWAGPVAGPPSRAWGSVLRGVLVVPGPEHGPLTAPTGPSRVPPAEEEESGQGPSGRRGGRGRKPEPIST